MININKILKPRYLLVLLVLGGGALFTMLQATSNECFSTADGDLTEQSTFGTYNGSAQSGCGSNLALDYIISAGNIVSWSGFEGPISGNVEVKSGGSLDINGNATFGGTLTNAGTLTVEASSDPATPTPPTSTFFTISNISGHTKEDGTTSTFNVALKDDSHFPSNPSSSSAPSSDIFSISAPSNSGHTKEDGTTSTFNVALKSVPSDDVTVSVSSSNNSEGTVSPSTLTFTPANWNSTQTVTVTGVNDSNSDGHQDYQISLSATVGVYENDITDNLNDSAYSFSSGSSPSHGNQDPEMAFDGTTNTKHFNSSGAGTGVIINTGTNKTVTTLGLTTANDRENRDPTSFSLYGSNNGSSWTSIVGNASLSPPASRYTNYSNVSISNSTAYQYFKLIWETTRQTTGPPISGATSDNGVQVSEIRLGGTLNTVESATVEMHNLDNEINVTVDVASSNTSEGTVSPATLTFTPDNWYTPPDSHSNRS